MVRAELRCLVKDRVIDLLVPGTDLPRLLVATASADLSSARRRAARRHGDRPRARARGRFFLVPGVFPPPNPLQHDGIVCFDFWILRRGTA